MTANSTDCELVPKNYNVWLCAGPRCWGAEEIPCNSVDSLRMVGGLGWCETCYDFGYDEGTLPKCCYRPPDIYDDPDDRDPIAWSDLPRFVDPRDEVVRLARALIVYEPRRRIILETGLDCLNAWDALIEAVAKAKS